MCAMVTKGVQGYAGTHQSTPIQSAPTPIQSTPKEVQSTPKEVQSTPKDLAVLGEICGVFCE